jgi:glutaminase
MSSDPLDALLTRMKSAAAPMNQILRDLHQQFAPISDGAVADYIPELAVADPAWFGISVITTDGRVFETGDHGQLFTIQSVSKPFVFGQALEDHGREVVSTKVGVEPTGESFNSIVLDEVSNRPFNPMVNAGAIAMADLLAGKDHPERVNRMADLFARYCGRTVYVDNGVFMSERATGHRNRAISWLMRNFDMVSDRIEESLELYFQQCSFMVNCHDLAVMGATLANGGVNPVTGQRAVNVTYVKDILSVMLSCGMYDYAGQWAYQVGIPAKSGVGGGIVGVVPGVCGIATMSPLLDERGNSIRGMRVFEALSERYRLHVLEAEAGPHSLAVDLQPERPQN